MDKYILRNSQTKKAVGLTDDLFNYIFEEYNDEVNMVNNRLNLRADNSNTNPKDFLMGKQIEIIDTCNSLDILNKHVIQLQIADGVLIGTNRAGQQIILD